MWDYLWDFFVDTLIALFLPMVCLYYVVCGDLFLNVSAQNATGFERAGNLLLTPLQYLFAGREAVLKGDGSWEFVQKFDYNNALWPKALASGAVLPASLVFGGAVKGLSYLSADTRKRHASILSTRQSREVLSNIDRYRQMGMEIGDMKTALFLAPEGHLRRPGDENYMKEAKEALREVAKVLNEANIPWWVDCGTLLGAYRYGGVIPWDNDIDISLLEPDFENTRRVFNRLDKSKYIVQDWSGRDFPNTYFKIYVRKTGHLIDVDFYEIDEQKKELTCIFSLENNIFCLQWWKTGEMRFKEPIAYDLLFPLKKGIFDGIEVPVPNQSKLFLRRYYGENLAPAKVFDPKTNRFEKDLSHPYWQNAYVH